MYSTALAVEYIDDDVRVMQGTTAYFVFRKVTCVLVLTYGVPLG